MQRMNRWLGGVALGAAVVLGWQMWSSGQQPAGDKGKESAATNRLEFELVHSFDAKYLGDTPGHMGRAGGLTMRKPRIAIGDKVFRGEDQVGIVTSLDWNRANNSLDIEFDPFEHARVCVGESVWVVFDNLSPLRTVNSPTPR